MFRAEGVEVDLARRLVSVDDAPVTLSRREYELLALMARNAGRVLTHRHLLTAVWGVAHGEDVQSCGFTLATSARSLARPARA